MNRPSEASTHLGESREAATAKKLDQRNKVGLVSLYTVDPMVTTPPTQSTTGASTIPFPVRKGTS